MTAPDAEWTITPEEVQAVLSYLGQHFTGGTVRALSEAADPGQLFQAATREATRHTVKLTRETLDDLRRHRIPLVTFLAKHQVARRMRGARRVVILRARGEDMIREERD